MSETAGLAADSLMQAQCIRKLASVQDLENPVAGETLAVPVAGTGEVLIRVHACGVCHTEIDEIEGRSPPSVLPMIPGHQVVGTVIAEGPGCRQGRLGKRVGVSWIYSACGRCRWCLGGLENLCSEFKACGRDAPGGYAEYMVANENFVVPIPKCIDDSRATPLLCAGAVGYRSLEHCRLTNGQVLGLTGFGASAHLVLQMARHLVPDSPIFVFARSPGEREFALSLGAAWAGDTRESSPQALDAVIDTTPVWLPILCALENLAPGGRLVINAIRKESADRHLMEHLDYERHLWKEKSIQSVANVTRNDVVQCLKLAVDIPLRPEIQEYPLDQAGEALRDLKTGNIRGAKVLKVQGD